VNYAYICEHCGPWVATVRADRLEHDCGKVSRRDWRFKVDLPFEPYYSPVFNTVVNSKNHARDLAKAASAEATARTGRDVNYEVIDLMDDEAVGITKEEKAHYAAKTREAAVKGAAAAPERKAEHDAERESVDA
jgi:hypothetical protein